MEFITFIIVYLVCAFITYIAHYYYIAYVYSKSKELQSKVCFDEHVKNSTFPRVLMACFWLFVLLSVPITLIFWAVYRMVVLIQNAIKKHFNIKL